MTSTPIMSPPVAATPDTAEQEAAFDRAASQLNVAQHTSAPLRLDGEFLFAVPPHELFPKLTEPSAIARWFGWVKSGHTDHSGSCNEGAWGTGSIRYCRSTLGTLEETLHAFEAPYLSAFSVKHWSLPMKDHYSVMLLEPLTTGGTRLIWRHYFNDSTPLLGRIMPKVLAAMINTAIRNLGNETGGSGGRMRVVPQRPSIDTNPALWPAEAHP